MLQIHSITFNAYQENTYIIINHIKNCWIIDPGMYGQREKQQFSRLVEQNGWQPQAIINTHAHPDHVFGVRYLQELYKIPFFIHEKELPILSSAASFAQMLGFNDFETPLPHQIYDDASHIMLDEEEVSVFFTPGHSPGSISFYHAASKWVVSGDVLFAQSIGRTDLPGGDFKTLETSIKDSLYTLPEDTIVYPGHGPATSVGVEKRDNPFVKSR